NVLYSGVAAAAQRIHVVCPCSAAKIPAQSLIRYNFQRTEQFRIGLLMRWTLFAIGLLLFTLYGTGIAIAQAPITVIPVVEVRFRAGPNTKFDILGKIPAGTSLTASARSPFSDWV